MATSWDFPWPKSGTFSWPFTDAVADALRSCGAPPGSFGLVVGDEAGKAALGHPSVKAAAFTGSVRVGRMLFDVANSRPSYNQKLWILDLTKGATYPPS